MGMLDRHPAVACYDELLLPKATDSGYWGRTDLEFFEPYYARHRKRDNRLTRVLWSFRYLNKLYSPRQGLDALGMKLMYSQLWKNPWVWPYMVQHRVCVVHLVRSNLLDIVISLETLKTRKQPHAWQGHDVETQSVRLDPKTLMSSLHDLEFRIKVARWLLTVVPIRHIEVSYEQLIANPALLDDVFAFLGTTTSPGTQVSKFKKLNTSSKPELIENYDEVRRLLSGTRFECFLDD